MYIIDRIEEGIAIVFDENENRFEIEALCIMGDPRDGAVIYKDNNIWTVDETKTKERNNNLKNRLNKLFSRKYN